MAEERADVPRTRSSSPAASERAARILEVAAREFHRSGYVDATTDVIAAEAGITKVTLYRYIGTKEQLCFDVQKDVLDRGLERWRAVLRRGGGPTRTLLALVEELVDVVMESPDAVAVLRMEMKHLDVEKRAILKGLQHEYDTIMQNVLEQGVLSGEFVPLDARIISLVILGMITDVYRWQRSATTVERPHEGSSPAEVTALLGRIILTGTRGQDPAQEEVADGDRQLIRRHTSVR